MATEKLRIVVGPLLLLMLSLELVERRSVCGDDLVIAIID